MLLKQAEQSVSVSHVPSTDDGARTLAGHMGAREAVCAISERVGCRSYRQKGNPLQAAPLPSREGNPLARRLSLPPRHSTLPGYSRSGQADPACASIKNTSTIPPESRIQRGFSPVDGAVSGGPGLRLHQEDAHVLQLGEQLLGAQLLPRRAPCRHP